MIITLTRDMAVASRFHAGREHEANLVAAFLNMMQGEGIFDVVAAPYPNDDLRFVRDRGRHDKGEHWIYRYVHIEYVDDPREWPTPLDQINRWGDKT